MQDDQLHLAYRQATRRYTPETYYTRLGTEVAPCLVSIYAPGLLKLWISEQELIMLISLPVAALRRLLPLPHSPLDSAT